METIKNMQIYNNIINGVNGEERKKACAKEEIVSVDRWTQRSAHIFLRF